MYRVALRSWVLLHFEKWVRLEYRRLCTLENTQVKGNVTPNTGLRREQPPRAGEKEPLSPT